MSSFGSPAISNETRGFASPPHNGFAFVVMFLPMSIGEESFPVHNSSNGIPSLAGRFAVKPSNFANADFRQQDVLPKRHIRETGVPKINIRENLLILRDGESPSSRWEKPRANRGVSRISMKSQQFEPGASRFRLMGSAARREPTVTVIVER